MGGTEENLQSTVGGAEGLCPTTCKKRKAANNDVNLEDPSPGEPQVRAQPWLTTDHSLVKSPEQRIELSYAHIRDPEKIVL